MEGLPDAHQSRQSEGEDEKRQDRDNLMPDREPDLLLAHKRVCEFPSCVQNLHCGDEQGGKGKGRKRKETRREGILRQPTAARPFAT